MVKESIREALADINPEIIVFDNPSYDDSIIGVSQDDRAIYSYEMMCEELMRDENFTEEEAIDWINYNTIRAIPYGGPIIMFDIERDGEN